MITPPSWNEVGALMAGIGAVLAGLAQLMRSVRRPRPQPRLIKDESKNVPSKPDA